MEENRMIEHIMALDYKPRVEKELAENTAAFQIIMTAAKDDASRWLREMVVQTAVRHPDVFSEPVNRWVARRTTPDWAREPFGEELALDVSNPRIAATVAEIARLITPPQER